MIQCFFREELQPVRAEIVSVGTELLLGQITDTNAVFLSQDLAARGIDVLHRSTVGDNLERLEAALRLALSRADIVITIGGLGPTQDDLTREACSLATGIPLVPDPDSERAIRDFFARRRVPFNEANLKQALKPERGTNLKNPNGTAPGCVFDCGERSVICLPGPPAELRPMWLNEAVPWLASRGFTPSEVLRSRVLRFVGIGESLLEPKVRDLMSSSNPTLAPYAKTGEVHLRITAKAPDEETARAMIAGMERAVRERAGEWLYGVDDETLEAVVVREALKRNVTLATAESCTGGLISSRITDVPGSSGAFLMGAVCYANEAKTGILGVPPGMIAAHGAVSEEVAIAMAEGARRRSGADVAVSDTGIAGPSGGTPEKPVGLVWIGISSAKGSRAERHLFAGDRATVKLRASQAALALLRRVLLEEFAERAGG
jgi:nicotinamide-nucleotide amidase